MTKTKANETKIVEVSVDAIKLHPDNPRFIRDEKFKLLCESLREFPEMLSKRPLIINDEDEVLGGNMRLRAAEEIGLKTVPVIFVDWSLEKQREFIIKDNASFGQWDFDQLANNWNNQDLLSWGLDVWNSDDNLDEFFNDEPPELKSKIDNELTITFEDQETKNRVSEALGKLEGSPAEAFIKLLKI